MSTLSAVMTRESVVHTVRSVVMTVHCRVMTVRSLVMTVHCLVMTVHCLGMTGHSRGMSRDSVVRTRHPVEESAHPMEWTRDSVDRSAHSEVMTRLTGVESHESADLSVQPRLRGTVPAMLGCMFHIGVPWWELVLRGVVVYAFLIVLLRLTGKRQVGQLAPFDLVMLLVLSNAVQNSMNGGDNSLVGGLLSATTLIAVNWLVGLATFRSKRLEAAIEGRPQVLVHNGKLFEDVLSRAKLTHHELQAALRQCGCACVEDVHTAILENNGSISVTQRRDRQSQAASGDA